MDLASKTLTFKHSMLHRIKTYGELVMFPHTLFSIPFGVISMLLAAGGFPPLPLTIWIVIALVSARTGANALNRLVDRDIDAKNPRTAGRHMPRGIVTVKEALALTAACFALLITAAFMIRPVCAMLLPVPITLIAVYSLTKRFTWACHLVLGAASACAPLGAWLAVTGDISWASASLGAAVMLWVAGFDIIYGILDTRHDRDEGIHSVPADFGVKAALITSSLFHLGSAALLACVGIMLKLGILYFVGITVVAALLIYEHISASPERPESLKTASYTMNQIVSMVFFTFSAAEILL